MRLHRHWRILVFCSTVFNCTTAISSDDWKWTVEPYLMASNIDGTAGIGRATGIDVKMDTGDILEKLELGAMIHAEALHQSGWGMIMDYGFMRLGDDLSLPLGGIVDVTLRQGVFEAMAFRRQVDDVNGYYDIYGGIRWWDNDLDVVVDPAVLPGSKTASIEEDWVDPVLGARYYYRAGDDWTLMAQADIGGFGLASDFSYTLAIGATYQLTDSMRLDLKLKGLWVDYEDGTRGTPGYFKYDTVTYGPIIGLAFDF